MTQLDNSQPRQHHKGVKRNGLKSRSRWNLILFVVVMAVIVSFATLYSSTVALSKADGGKTFKSQAMEAPMERTSILSSNLTSSLKERDQHIAVLHSSNNPDATVLSSNISYLDDSFVYANQTYNYRFSPKLFRKYYYRLSKTTKSNGQEKAPFNSINNSLPTIAFGVCANAVKGVRRQAARETWGKHVPIVFLMAGDWDTVSSEFARTGDVLWLDIPEDYRNALTPKSFAFIHLISKYFMSPSSKEKVESTAISPTIVPLSVDYLFKTDDDVYVNATEMSIELALKGMPDYYGILRNGTSPIRDKESKWYMSRKEFPQEVFPDYAHGTGYALSQRFAHCVKQSLSVPTSSRPNLEVEEFMPWEDVATGIMAEKCHISLTPADDQWDHFIPFETSEWIQFPYLRFRDGGVLVKILHKVRPWFFEPLSQQASLVEARQYGTKRVQERRQRRMDKDQQQQQLQK